MWTLAEIVLIAPCLTVEHVKTVQHAIRVEIPFTFLETPVKNVLMIVMFAQTEHLALHVLTEKLLTLIKMLAPFVKPVLITLMGLAKLVWLTAFLAL